MMSGRVLQAIGAGMMPLGSNVIVTIFPPEKRCVMGTMGITDISTCNRSNTFRLHCAKL